MYDIKIQWVKVDEKGRITVLTDNKETLSYGNPSRDGDDLVFINGWESDNPSCRFWKKGDSIKIRFEKVVREARHFFNLVQVGACRKPGEQNRICQQEMLKRICKNLDIDISDLEFESEEETEAKPVEVFGGEEFPPF